MGFKGVQECDKWQLINYTTTKNLLFINRNEKEFITNIYLKNTSFSQIIFIVPPKKLTY